VLDKPVLQLVPHWNWPADSIGKNIRVMVLSNAEKVKLYLNKKLITEAPVDKYEMLTVNVPYQPGKLEAVGYKNGKEVSRFVVETTTEPVSLELIPDRQNIEGDGLDALPVTVRALDAKGRPVQTANLPVEFEVSGAGTIIGLGNGDANSHAPEKGNKRNLYNGLAQVILQSKSNSSGQLTLTARSGNLKPATITINVKDTLQQPAVPVVKTSFAIAEGWHISPFYTNKTDAEIQVASNELNSWNNIWNNYMVDFNEGNFLIYRAAFKPLYALRNEGGRLMLKAVTGKAEVWLDKKLIATKTTFEKGDIIVNLEPSPALTERIISVLIESEKGKKAGLEGKVTLNPLD
jgi:beta-galactosidase